MTNYLDSLGLDRCRALVQ